MLLFIAFAISPERFTFYVAAQIIGMFNRFQIVQTPVTWGQPGNPAKNEFAYWHFAKCIYVL
jgi:hypothetical protein